jgi:hypothetical protein
MGVLNQLLYLALFIFNLCTLIKAFNNAKKRCRRVLFVETIFAKTFLGRRQFWRSLGCWESWFARPVQHEEGEGVGWCRKQESNLHFIWSKRPAWVKSSNNLLIWLLYQISKFEKWNYFTELDLKK